jgi:PPIC-type PPIASE domain
MNSNLKSRVPSQQSALATKRPARVEAERILYHLSRSPLLVKYLRGVIIDETLEIWEQSPEFRSIVSNIDLSILNKNRQAVLFQLYKKAEFGRFVRSRFLVQKSQLDRVLISVIQVQNLQLAQELYFRIEEQKQPFAKLAIKYSDGTTAKRGGSIGPILSCQLSFPIQYHLTGLQPKQLSPIFQVGEHYLFLRLDRSLPAQLNPQIEQQLLDELFDEWLHQEILDRIGKASVIISSPVIGFPQIASSKTEELAISKNLAVEDVRSSMISPTSSFFFPTISPAGEILSSNIGGSHQVKSSFFPPSELSVEIRSHPSSQNRLWSNTIAFILFFCLFLTGGIAGIKFFSQPPIRPPWWRASLRDASAKAEALPTRTRSKSLLGEIHKLPLRVTSNVVKVVESSAFLGGKGGG